MRINTRKDQELENYFFGIKASFTRKFIASFLDVFIVFVLCVPLFIIICHLDETKGDWYMAFNKIIQKNTTVKASRLAACASLLFVVEYFYFVIIPSRFKFQTLGSKYCGVRAVTTSDSLNWKGNLSQKQLIKANFIPIFLFPLINIIVFVTCYLTGHESDWQSKLKDDNILNPAVKTLVAIAFFIQIHYMFTVAASRKALNYFTKSNGMVYVNTQRANLLMSTEDRPIPNPYNLDEIGMPGANQSAYKVLNEKMRKKNMDEFDSIDFSKEIPE